MAGGLFLAPFTDNTLFQRAWQRLKLSLKSDVCRGCDQAPLEADHQWLCAACEQTLGLNGAKPLFKRHQAQVFSAFMMGATLKRILYGLKFFGDQGHGLRLAEYLLHYYQWTNHQNAHFRWEQPPLLLTLPHRAPVILENQGAAALRPHRSFNHLAAIARPFAAQCGWEYRQGGLEWQRKTVPQHQLAGRRERWHNLRGALRLNDAVALSLQTDPRPVVILDDLITTGATMTEALAAVRRAGHSGPLLGLSLAHLPFRGGQWKSAD